VSVGGWDVGKVTTIVMYCVVHIASVSFDPFIQIRLVSFCKVTYQIGFVVQ